MSSSVSNSAAPRNSFHTDVEIQGLQERFERDPHSVYTSLSAMSHSSLVVLTAQLLSLRTAPLIGPASSSRVGPDLSALRRGQVSRSIFDGSVPGLPPMDYRDTLELSVSARRELAAATAATATISASPPMQRTTDVALNPPNAVIASAAEKCVAMTPVSLPELEDDVTTRAMSTHDLEATIRSRCEYRNLFIPLKDIYFYQDYICNQFMDGRQLTSTIEDLQSGKLTPESLPLIECLNYRGRWYGMGNRRLSCFHFVYRSTPEKLIPVKGLYVADNQPFYPQGDGLSVRLGGGTLIAGRIVFSMKHCSQWSDPFL